MCFHLSLSNYLPLLKQIAVIPEALKHNHFLKMFDFYINNTTVVVLNATSNN